MPGIPQIAAMMQEIVPTTVRQAAERTGVRVRHRLRGPSGCQPPA
jgi:hypothetical protein